MNEPNVRPVRPNTTRPVPPVNRNPEPEKPKNDTPQPPSRPQVQEVKSATEEKRKVMPPMVIEPEPSFLEDEQTTMKKSIWKKVGIGLGVVVVVAGLMFGTAYFSSNGKVPIVEGGQPNQLENMTAMSGGNNSVSGKSTFTGDPVPVKWPSDVQPTRMEVLMNPVSGDPVLLLVGDKQGLGTVLRSYDKSGSLVGYWVIVPDNGTNAQTNNQQSTNNTESTNQTSNTDSKETDKSNQ